MREYLKRFRVLFIFLLCMLAVYGVLVYIRGEQTEYVRTNTSCKTDERVFDYGDKLTDQQEDALRRLIAKREAQIGCDIVLVTLNEPVGDSMNALMNYADDFYDENQFGYDEAWGDGVLLVDNWYSFGDYNGDTWLSTSGRVEHKYSNAMINSLLDYVCDVVNANPYDAYTRYVNRVYEDMSGNSFAFLRLSGYLILGIAAVVTLLYLIINLSAEKGRKTTTAQTYIVSGNSYLHDKQDVLLTKNVTRRIIQTSSSGGSGGGGGHHISSGGHSHGGGGRHH